MANKSPLRQLAQEYYDGSIDRPHYLRQRQNLLDSMVSGGDQLPPLEGATIPGVFTTVESGQLDSVDLSIALAQRPGAPEAGGGELDPQGQDNLRNTIPTGEVYARAGSSDISDEQSGRAHGDADSRDSVKTRQASKSSYASKMPANQWVRGAIWIVGGLFVIALVIVLR